MKISRMAKVDTGDGFKLLTCSSSRCKPDIHGKIDLLYSMKHASDEGWRSTDSIKYSEDGQFVFLCPDCSGFKPSALITLKGNLDVMNATTL
jgi:hypothetical protein